MKHNPSMPDEYERLHKAIAKSIREGQLPPITFSHEAIKHIPMVRMSKEEFARLYPPIDKL